ncbi:MAG: polyprenyl synthetase family protein [Candidatus Bathyarchaeia archaeon]
MVDKKVEKLQEVFRERGKASYEIAKMEILKEKIGYKPVQEALQYFIEELWHNFHHPTLLSLTCEAVGGNSRQTTKIGAAIVLLTGAADIHDDIIDGSLTKAFKPTVLGKFGVEIALLAGDALFLKGYELLCDSCKNLTVKQKNKVIQWVRRAFFDLGVAVAKETALKGKWDVNPKEYLDIIAMKAAIADVTARVGALIGGGRRKEIIALGKYGRTLGTLATIRDDFIDILEPQELQNRVQNECLPLPFLYALQDQKARDKIIHMLEKDEFTDKDCWNMLKEIRKSPSFNEFIVQLKTLLRKGQCSLRTISINQKIENTLLQMLDAMVEDII